MIHFPALDGSSVSSVHVGHLVLVFEVVEEKVFLGMVSHYSEKRRLAFHPVERLDERVVGDSIYCLEVV